MGPGAGTAQDLADHVRDIPDFPEPGIVFKDLTPLLVAPDGLGRTIGGLTTPFEGLGVDRVLGVEARGFIFAPAVAERLGAGFVPVRKPGKLPWQIEHEEYELEYGRDRLEIHRDAITPGQRVVIIDDVLATGGTAAATARLVHRLGGELVGFGFVVELTFLAGRDLLPPVPVTSLITY